METLLVSIFAVLNWSITAAVQLADRRQMSPERRARVWTASTWGAAVYQFGFLSMIPWVWVTRQEWPTWRRHGLASALARAALTLLIGALSSAVVLAVLWALASLAEWCLVPPARLR